MALFFSQQIEDVAQWQGHTSSGRRSATYSAGVAVLQEAGAAASLQGRLRGMQRAVDFFKQHHQLDDETKYTTAHMALLRKQAELEQSTGRHGEFLNTSVVQTLHTLVCAAPVDGMWDMEGWAQSVDDFAAEFKVSKKQLYHVKVRALADSGQWQSLWELSNPRASLRERQINPLPIGLKYFAQACKRSSFENEQHHDEGERYTILPVAMQAFAENHSAELQKLLRRSRLPFVKRKITKMIAKLRRPAHHRRAKSSIPGVMFAI